MDETEIILFKWRRHFFWETYFHVDRWEIWKACLFFKPASFYELASLVSLMILYYVSFTFYIDLKLLKERYQFNWLAIVLHQHTIIYDFLFYLFLIFYSRYYLILYLWRCFQCFISDHCFMLDFVQAICP